MALDFGIYSALRGVTSTLANSRAEARKNNMQIVDNMYNEHQERVKQDMEYEMHAADYFDKVNDIANEAVVRPQDREYVQGLSDKLQEEIARNVKQYGGYTKFMQGGGWKQIRDYKKQLVESDDFTRMKTNAANFAKIKELSDDGKTAHLIYDKDSKSINNYFSGATDNISYSGVKGEVDLQTIVDNTPKNVPITVENILSHDQNYQALSTNMGVEWNINRSDFSNSDWNQLLGQYVNQQPEFAGLKTDSITGAGDHLPFDVGSDILQNIVGINQTTQLGDDMRAVLNGPQGDLIRSSYGVNLQEDPLRNYDNAARVMTATQLENGWGSVVFGDNWKGMGAEMKVNLANGKLNFYDEDGAQLNTDDSPLSSSGFMPGVGRTLGVGAAGASGGIGSAYLAAMGTSTIGGLATAVTTAGPIGAVAAGGAALLAARRDWFKYDEVEDLTPTGIYMVQKISWKDKDGIDRTSLIPSQKNAEDIAKEFGPSHTVTNTFAMRFAYDRVGKFDDDIMMELPQDKFSLGELSKTVDMNDILQEQRDATTTTARAAAPTKRKIEQLNELKTQFAGSYSDAMGGRSYDEFYSRSMPMLSTIVQNNELPVNSMNPIIALSLELSKGKGPEAYQQSLISFNNISAAPGGQDLMESLKMHDMFSFFNILEKDFGISKKQQNQIRNTIKDLSLTQQFM